MPDHIHDHDHAEMAAPGRPGYFDMLQLALEEALIKRKILQPGEIERQIDVLDSRTPALGAKIIARARTDPAVPARLLADGRGTCEEVGIKFYDDTGLIVLENTETVHNLVVCTLCSCYPRPLLGPPPAWYKLKPYRARAVIALRKIRVNVLVPGATSTPGLHALVPEGGRSPGHARLTRRDHPARATGRARRGGTRRAVPRLR